MQLIFVIHQPLSFIKNINQQAVCNLRNASETRVAYCLTMKLCAHLSAWREVACRVVLLTHSKVVAKIRLALVSAQCIGKLSIYKNIIFMKLL